MSKWSRIIYQPNLPLYEGKRITASAEHIELSKDLAAQGMVLLKNEDKILPLKKNAKIAVFGKALIDYVKGGGGSGDVTVAYTRNLYEGFKKLGDTELFEPLADFYKADVAAKYKEGGQPGMIPEPELPEELLDRAREFTDTALFVISRFSGEDWDRAAGNASKKTEGASSRSEEAPTDGSEKKDEKQELFPRSDYFFSPAEEKLFNEVSKRFDKIIAVLNVGGMVDLTWIKNNNKVKAGFIMWQGGIEGGLAAAECLTGRKDPCGKLPDTFANSLADYPSTAGFHESKEYVDYNEDIYVGYRYFETVPGAAEKVCYPFGYGLSYTTFLISTENVYEKDGEIVLNIRVTNTGDVAGKESVQVYYSAPQGVLGKPAKELAGFKKTSLLEPGENELLMISFRITDMASYDDLGKIQRSAYVLEKGVYTIFAGNSVRNVEEVYTIGIEENIITEQLSAKVAPTSLKARMLADGSYEDLPQLPPHDPYYSAYGRMERYGGITPDLKGVPGIKFGDPELAKNRQLIDVYSGKITMEEFLTNLSDDDLISVVGGQPNVGISNTWCIGNLPMHGVPSFGTADGPAGVRIQPHVGVCTTAWPCATMVAASFDTGVAEALGRAAAEELKELNLAIWLAPALNIHRSPLCGRNFEYYSEDPVLAGKMGAADVRGVQSMGVAATPKHFACNNKETNRYSSDSRVSERALREIYLKGFEIIVKEADPWFLMSSYNFINGQRASECEELLEGILRDEWGYRGAVTTDWWNTAEQYKEVIAGNDVKMPNGYDDRLKKALADGLITREQLERNAGRLFELMLKID